MIVRFYRRMVKLLKDPSRSFKDRVFLLLTMVTDVMALLALVGDIAVGENIVEIITLAVIVVTIPFVTMFAIRTNKVQIAVRLVVIGLVVLLLPTIYYFGGGITGGGVLWFIFAYLYSGLVLSGKWKPLMLVILTAEAVFFYTVDFMNPGIVSLHDRKTFYIDSLISIVMVGIICCMMAWFVEWLLQEENKRAREEAKKFEELNRTQNRFFSSMSHEIRTPINSILGLNELILRQEDASDEIKKDAGNIQGAGKMLLALVNDILDISKIEAGKMDIVPVNYSVSELISEIVNMLWLRAEQKGLEFKVEIDPSIPQELFGDEVRIKQILVNILNNAVKYTKEGSVTLHIEKEDIKDDSVRLMFSVTDTGMGIKQDSLPYLFDAFRRTDEEKNRNIEGTGLGLSIVKQLVDLMGGEIAVNSIYTQGSTFTVALWQKVSNPSAVGNISISSSGSIRDDRKYEPGFIAPDARILIVDDNELNLEVEKKLIAKTRIVVDTADSGAMALSMTSSFRYDLILMDHLMPEMDGIQCLQNIRKQRGGLNNHAPIIVLTANAGSENRELYSISGFDGYLLKPVSGQQLEETLMTNLPESKVTRTTLDDRIGNKMNTAKGYSKKTPILIATSTLCDLPIHIFFNYQIEVIPFKVNFEGKEYYDAFEADSDEIIRYMKEGKEFESAPPSVEEFENFFGRLLKKAHQVIYLTVADLISEERKNAAQAAKNYGNVFVYDSGVNSSSLGMMVLLAYKMSTTGMTPGSIISELNRIKNKIQCSFVTSNPAVLLKRGITGKGMYGFMDSIGLKPFMRVKNNTFKMDRFILGSTKRGFEKYVKYAIPRGCRPDLDLLFITYVDLSNEVLNDIKKLVLSRVPFKNVIFQKASAVLALTCGPGAFGILYMENIGRPYNLDKVVVFNQEDYYLESHEEPAIQRDEEETHNWYDDIQGIDPQIALENSGGSVDTLKSVMGIFYRSIDEKVSEIQEFFDKEDLENYTIKVHALKSSARIIGAISISNDAAGLEAAGKENNTDYIRAHHHELIKELMAFKKPLSVVFESEESMEEDEFTQEDEKEAPVVTDYEAFLIKSMYETLEEEIQSQKETALAGTFEEMSEFSFPDEHKEILADLKSSFEDRDYDRMKEILQKGKELI